MTSEAELLADGWERLPATHFNDLSGPYYGKIDDQGRIVGLISEERHSNGHLNVLHGGVLMTFADVALGCACGDVLDVPMITTIQLQYNFTASAKIGSFITCRPELIRKTSTMIFVRGLVMAGDRTLGSADGIWRILDSEKLAAIRGD